MNEKRKKNHRFRERFPSDKDRSIRRVRRRVRCFRSVRGSSTGKRCSRPSGSAPSVPLRNSLHNNQKYSFQFNKISVFLKFFFFKFSLNSVVVVVVVVVIQAIVVVIVVLVVNKLMII